jgi:hypothetical protein
LTTTLGVVAVLNLFVKLETATQRFYYQPIFYFVFTSLYFFMI